MSDYIKLEGKLKVKTRPGATKVEARKVSGKEVTATTRLLMSYVRSNCPSRTGALRKSHKTTRTSTDSTVTATVTAGAGLDYAEIVHNGTGRRRANPWLALSARSAAYSRRWKYASGTSV